MQDRPAARRQYSWLAGRLAERIGAGEFRDAGRLPPERELAQAYAVGRPTVRDALIMLEVQGAIEVRHGSGAHVIDPQHAQPSRAQAPAAHDAPAGPFDLVEARQWIEAQVARCAALAATPEDVAAITAACEAHRAADHDADREALDADFHRAIARATRNDEMASIVERLWARRGRNPMWRRLHRRTRDPRHRGRWEEDHAEIVAAIGRRDPEGAYAAMWAHLEHVKRFLVAIGGLEASAGPEPAA